LHDDSFEEYMATSATIGNLQVTALVDLTPPPRDVSSIYPDVPADDWGPYQDFALENGMWQTQFCAFLIKAVNGDGPIVLVDTAMGPGEEPGKLLEELAASGVDPADISAVVTTHPHGDHVGWNVSYDGDSPRATFPNARYMLARADWDYWTSDEIAANVPAIGKSVQPLAGLGVLHLVDGEEEVIPGVKILPANGHTPGHQVVVVESNGETGVISATCSTTSHRSRRPNGVRCLTGTRTWHVRPVVTFLAGPRAAVGRCLLVTLKLEPTLEK
jgi:glyoxylase-like metal-dependent hydrolase (beta-lactamase superfamily II)